MRTHITERLPWEYRICAEGISEVLRHAWRAVFEGDAKINKISAMSLIAQCYKERLEIATNAYIVTDALNQLEKMKNEILGLDRSQQANKETSSTTTTNNIKPTG